MGFSVHNNNVRVCVCDMCVGVGVCECVCGGRGESGWLCASMCADICCCFFLNLFFIFFLSLGMQAHMYHQEDKIKEMGSNYARLNQEVIL